jgi:hypothetical protein
MRLRTKLKMVALSARQTMTSPSLNLPSAQRASYSRNMSGQRCRNFSAMPAPIFPAQLQPCANALRLGV